MILDTNALSALADGDESLSAELHGVTALYLPVIVLGEYRFGIRASRYRRTYEKWLKQALGDISVLPVLEETTEHYAVLCGELKKAGTPVPSNDVWVAALCREHAMPLISRDRHFDAVKGLRRISW
jgi:tRNA(fMet)-specific endonuclease VapC